MNAESITTDIEWDCKVVDGVVPLLSEDEEDLQCATIAAFLIQSTVPQLLEAGVPWTEFLQKKISFGELDFYIRNSLQKVGKDTYYPTYDIQNDKLVLSVGKLNKDGETNEL